ncbi:MAG: hypothetical protein Q8K74_13045, partial [Candidatus Nitrotoga sp.]|nr:hypothetical protein [Candidatus Nitrotoga sp.]MDP1856938.1 hypothetical protein [Candidatus Nitrotoga sp.]
TCSYLFLSLSVVGTTLRKITAWAGTLTGKANQVMTTSIGRGFLTLNKWSTLLIHKLPSSIGWPAYLVVPIPSVFQYQINIPNMA